MPLGTARAVLTRAVAPDLILAGISGALAEWDGELSAKTGSNPVTQWNDLIGTNHFTEDHSTGTGAGLTTIGGRGALDFVPTQHYDGGAITMPAPSTGFTICVVVQPDTVASNQIFIGRRGDAAASGGFSLWVQTAPTYRSSLSDGVTLVTRQGNTNDAAAGTTAIVQGGYNASVVKYKCNGNTPLTTAHSLTSLGGQTAFGLGAWNETTTSNPLDGKILWVGVCNGLLSDADMATVATRLNSRFTVF